MKRTTAALQIGAEISDPSEDADGNAGAAPTGTDQLVWPMPKAFKLTDCFGSETKHHDHRHSGLDIVAPPGSDVLAASDGVVTRAGPASGYGPNFVAINGDGGIGTSYGHMQKMTVKVGQHVKAGDKIGEEGTEGQSTGFHLHFNVFKGNYTNSDHPNVSPLKYVSLPKGVQNPDGCSAAAK